MRQTLHLRRPVRTARFHHLLVVRRLLDEYDEDDLESAGPVNDFDERDYFSTLSHLLDCLDLNLVEHDATMNEIDRLPDGQLERESCARILRTVRALMKELDDYQCAGYVPVHPLIEINQENKPGHSV